MSGNGFVSDCPCCGTKGSMECQSDHRPHDMGSGTCVQCGYQYWTELGFTDKENLEELRADHEYKPVELTDEMRKRIEEYCTSYNLGKYAYIKAMENK